MSDRGVIYQFSGERHAVQLVCSLWTLRQHYDGPVTILAGCERSIEFSEKMAADNRLGDLTVREWAAPTGRRNIGYANKTRMSELTPYTHNVFLDADTIVVGDFSDLWPEGNELILTKFTDKWDTHHPIMSKRIRAWEDVCPQYVARQMWRPKPAINTGVIGFTKGHPFFDEWIQVTLAKLCFICDEIAAQLVYESYRSSTRLLDDRWNASVVYVPDKDVRIWHGHGKKFMRKPKGVEVWLPVLEECMRENVARVAEWAPAGDRYLSAWLDGKANRETLNKIPMLTEKLEVIRSLQRKRHADQAH